MQEAQAIQEAQRVMKISFLYLQIVLFVKKLVKIEPSYLFGTRYKISDLRFIVFFL